MFSYLCVEFGDGRVSDLCSVSNSITLITIVIIVLPHLFESISFVDLILIFISCGITFFPSLLHFTFRQTSPPRPTPAAPPPGLCGCCFFSERVCHDFSSPTVHTATICLHRPTGDSETIHVWIFDK